MATAAEGAQAKQNIAAALAGGIETLSLEQEITFTQYIRLVLPLDGFVFWVRSDLLTTSALLNTFALNEEKFNEASVLAAAAPTITVKGSFHYSTRTDQNEAETEANNTVIFSALSPIQQFNELEPNILWIAEYGGDIEGFDGPITFAFSARGKYYNAADLFHYSGTAVLPAFKAQLITRADQLVTRELYISNSLPIWLQLSQYVPPYYPQGFTCSLPLFPSFLVPDNLEPPYGVIHIGEEDTETLQSAPFYGPSLSQYSLCLDRVKVTLYGLTNEAALSFLSAVLQFSYDYNTIGMVNMPTIRDEKRTASELGVLAQKKSIRFEVTYNQSTIRESARAYIASVIVNYIPRYWPNSGNSTGFLTLYDLILQTGIAFYLNGQVIMVPNGSGLPTSSVGLSAGMLWSNGGVLMATPGYSISSPTWIGQVFNSPSSEPGYVWSNGLAYQVS